MHNTNNYGEYLRIKENKLDLHTFYFSRKLYDNNPFTLFLVVSIFFFFSYIFLFVCSFSFFLYILDLLLFLLIFHYYYYQFVFFYAILVNPQLRNYDEIVDSPQIFSSIKKFKSYGYVISFIDRAQSTRRENSKRHRVAKVASFFLRGAQRLCMFTQT